MISYPCEGNLNFLGFFLTFYTFILINEQLHSLQIFKINRFQMWANDAIVIS